ncbi:MAG: C10 family peptidase, partial [Bacteroidales bacterium]|nr:C10 family peptidase [Bacteroidales bacterium]
MLLILNPLAGFVFKLKLYIMRLFVNIAVFLVLLVFFKVQGKEVQIEKAALVATNFYFDRSELTIKQFPLLQISDTATISNDQVNIYYIFHFTSGGFVIIAADDRCYPVIGYSFEKQVYLETGPPSFESWMEEVKKQVGFVKKNKIAATNRINSEWQKYLTYKPLNKLTSKPLTGIEPLIQSKWGQRVYYNSMCPIDPDGPGGHAIAGCVPIALAQVMFYFRHPETGTGEYTYYDNNYGTISANFGETTYHWDEMVNAIHLQGNPALAQLIFHAGVSIETNYGSGASGASTEDTEDALQNYFNYHDGLQYRSWYDFQDSFKDSLIENLNRNLPLIYRGGDFTSSHSFVCDGYQDTSYFHFNWGWDGGYNGYYLIENLNPGGYDFTFNQGAVMNIFPNENYPLYCYGPDTLQTLRGTFTDGSGPKKYLPGSTCSWLINPGNPDVTNIQLWFTSFETEEGFDIVNVYEGNTVNHPLIASFSGTEIPPHITAN